MTYARSAFSPVALTLLLAACSGSVSNSTAGTGGEAGTTTGTTGGGATTGTTSTGGSTSTGTGGMPAPSMVSFSYKPAWAGVTAVDVIGGFGQATDWDPKNPFVKLTMGSGGTWTGTAILPAGQYPYVFHVTGDAGGPMGHPPYAVDPTVSAFVACPMASPTYDKNNPNPCSQLTVPQGSPDTAQKVTGKVLYGGMPIKGYLVWIERDEAMSHHYFANRVDSAADGTFELDVASGQWRLQVLHPTMASMTDTQREPMITTLAAQRRAISASFPVKTAGVPMDPVEMEYLGYASFSPTGTVTPVPSATTPTTFELTVIASATMARAAVYGTMNGAGKSIGDPWWESAYGTATSASFNGSFPLKQALETTVTSGESYFWGTWTQLKGQGGPAWQGESMVVGIKWM
jgi:hypothetical protein